MTMLLRTSEESQTRILTTIGAGVVFLVVVAIAGYFVVDPANRKPKNVFPISIETPYVGQGVVAGTPIIMHGVQVGEITAVSSQAGGHVRIQADLQSGPTAKLTDAAKIDFRPANYFGVTGINLIPDAGGQPLRAGSLLNVTPKGNFALQALLYRLGELSHQVVTNRLISVVERATRYTDALTPLLETMITVSRTVTNVQTVGTGRLLRNATGINVAFPGFADGLIDTGERYLYSYPGLGFDPEQDLRTNPYVSTYDSAMMDQYNEARHLLATDPDTFVFGRAKEWLKGAETDLFSKVGNLLSTHMYELFPVVDQIRILSDIVPKLVPAQDISDTLRELRTRLERMYAGSGEQRALQVRILLDQVPGVAGPVGLALGAAGASR
jgi:hypothetical protein